MVLALLGLATALVAPSGFRMIESWRRATEVDASLQAIAALGANAAQQGRARSFEAGQLDPKALDGLPEGWTVELDAPLSLQANGACSDSRGRLRGPGGYEQPFEVQAPFCRTRKADSAP